MTSFKQSTPLWAKTILTVAFAACTLIFWNCVSPFHLHYLEQNRIFECTSEFFIRHLSYPGGLTSYIGAFITQFFFKDWCCGVIMALLLVAVQILSWRAMSEGNYIFSFIPAILLWMLLCKTGNMIEPVAAVIIATGTFCALRHRRCAVTLPATVLLYWMCGPIAILFSGLMAIELTRRGKIVYAASHFILAAFLPLAAACFVQMPLSRLYFGIAVNLNPGTYHFALFATPASIFAAAAASKVKSNLLIDTATFVAVTIISCFCINLSIEKPLETALAYDYHASHSQWDEILKLAENKTPKTPMEVSCLNLALAEKGELGEKMFSYFQKGPSRLFPDFSGSYLQMVAAAEPLFRAGLLNMSMRYTFEAYASFPDFYESPRHLKRLAEINLINGKYDVAARYLRKLSTTLFYKEWAKPLLDNPSSIEGDSRYAGLTACRDTSDFIFNDNGKIDMLRHIVRYDSDLSQPALQYVIAYDLLAKNLPAFANDIAPLLDRGMTLPRHWQEALLFLKAIDPDNAGRYADNVSDEVKARFEAYRNDVFTRKSEQSVKKAYGDTFWLYMVNDN